ncbi:hypothetical protein EOM71_01490 [Candidatus Falkowbacteria bacterium]|nr:hypothetical protein [Candidatus Falkowbacteria bacterium]
MNLRFLLKPLSLKYFFSKRESKYLQKINQLEEQNVLLKSELCSRKQRARTLAHDSNNFLYQVDSVLELVTVKSLDSELVGLANAIRSRTFFLRL